MNNPPLREARRYFKALIALIAVAGCSSEPVAAQVSATDSAKISAIAPLDRMVIRDRNRDGRIVIACIGDSNTQVGFLYETTWCERLETLIDDPNWSTINRGWSGATATGISSIRTAKQQLDYVLAFDAIDAAVLAFGTNDLLRGATPAKLVAAYSRLLRRAKEHGVDAFIALTPPVTGKLGESNARIKIANDMIRDTFPPERVVDFWSEMTPENFVDKIHLNEKGHDLRARAAWRALRPPR